MPEHPSKLFRASDLDADEPVIVGSDGGDSEFGGLIAAGGAGGGN